MKVALIFCLCSLAQGGCRQGLQIFSLRKVPRRSYEGPRALDDFLQIWFSRKADFALVSTKLVTVKKKQTKIGNQIDANRLII